MFLRGPKRWRRAGGLTRTYRSAGANEFYLVSMPHHPRASVIEAFSTWMRAFVEPGVLVLTQL
jgi:hypothetical protein